MLFEREGKKPVSNLTEKQLVQHLRNMKRHTGEIAILSKSDQEYIQMMGGGVSSCVEWRTKGRQYRAYKQSPHVAWTETTLMHGSNKVETNEHLLLDEVIELFKCYLKEENFPEWVRWRDMTDDLKRYGIRF